MAENPWCFWFFWLFFQVERKREEKEKRDGVSKRQSVSESNLWTGPLCPINFCFMEMTYCGGEKVKGER